MTDRAAPPDVSILIVAYNSADCIADCLRALPDACAGHTYEVLIIDNGDGATENLVRRDFPEVKVLPSHGNIGFARGNNLLADAAGAGLLLLLNPDMVPFPGAIDALIEGTRQHPDGSAWGGVTLNPDGRPDSGNSIAIPSLAEYISLVLGRSIEGNRAIRGLRHDEPTPILSGGFVLIAKRVWEQAGGLDPRYFLYCEEVDLFYRLGRRGHTFWRIAEARSIHNAGHGSAASPVRLLYKTAGSVEFMRLHWSRPARFLGIGLLWIAAIERHCAGMLLGQWRPHRKIMGEAYRLVARRPDLWIGGYHPQRGLLARLTRAKGVQ